MQDFLWSHEPKRFLGIFQIEKGIVSYLRISVCHQFVLKSDKGDVKASVTHSRARPRIQADKQSVAIHVGALTIGGGGGGKCAKVIRMM